MTADLEQRVAELEAAMERLTQPAGKPQWTEEQVARLRERFAQAVQQQRPLQVIPPVHLGPDEVRQVLRESLTVVKPGEVLVLRCPENFTPCQVREIGDAVLRWLEYNAPDLKVMVIPDLDMAVIEQDATA